MEGMQAEEKYRYGYSKIRAEVLLTLSDNKWLLQKEGPPE
jgi:hypothetical protein